MVMRTPLRIVRSRTLCDGFCDLHKTDGDSWLGVTADHTALQARIAQWYDNTLCAGRAKASQRMAFNETECRLRSRVKLFTWSVPGYQVPRYVCNKCTQKLASGKPDAREHHALHTLPSLQGPLS